MRESYGARRALLIDGLSRLGLEVPVIPRGAFYVFADARRFGSDSTALASKILEQAHVAVTPGIDFGEAGEGFLRFSCTAPEARLREALERIGRVLG
jgi:aspartate/methionine/tyrosine aminotransferase